VDHDAVAGGIRAPIVEHVEQRAVIGHGRGDRWMGPVGAPDQVVGIGDDQLGGERSNIAAGRFDSAVIR